MRPHPLDDDLHSKISDLCAEGDQRVECGDLSGALKSYQEALGLLPEPKLDWEASAWILAAIGETQFFSGNLQAAKSSLLEAIRAPDGLGNPLLHLRLGQVHFELGDMERAKEELVRAFMGAGEEIFADEDPKYRSFLHEHLRPAGAAPDA